MRLVKNTASRVASKQRRPIKSIKEFIMSTSVVLITGGLTGIGRAAAMAFAKEGAMVTVSYRTA
jgi:hypothetical protein